MHVAAGHGNVTNRRQAEAERIRPLAVAAAREAPFTECTEHAVQNKKAIAGAPVRAGTMPLASHGDEPSEPSSSQEYIHAIITMQAWHGWT